MALAEMFSEGTYAIGGDCQGDVWDQVITNQIQALRTYTVKTVENEVLGLTSLTYGAGGGQLMMRIEVYYALCPYKGFASISGNVV